MWCNYRRASRKDVITFLISNRTSATLFQMEKSTWEQGINILDYISASVNIRRHYRVWDITNMLRIKDRYVAMDVPIGKRELEKELKKIK